MNMSLDKTTSQQRFVSRWASLALLSAGITFLFLASVVSACPDDQLDKAQRLYRRAQTISDLTGLEEKELQYEAALSFCPDLVRVRLELGIVRFRLARRMQAQSSGDESKVRGCFEGAADALRQVSGLGPTDQAKAATYLSLSLIGCGKTKEASVAVEGVDPALFPLVHFAAAEVAYHRYQDSGDESEKGVAENGYLRFLREPAAAAALTFREDAEHRLIELRYGHAGRLLNEASRSCGRRPWCTEVLPSIESAVEKAGRPFPEAHLAAAKSLMQSTSVDWDRFESHLRAALELPQARLMLAKRLIDTDRLEEAARILGSGPPEPTDEQEWTLRRATLAARQGDMQAAETLLGKCRRIDPATPFGQTCAGFLPGSPAAETSATGAAADREIGEYGGIAEDPRQTTLQTIADTIADKASMPPATYRVRVLASDRVQGFAARTADEAGVYLTRGMLGLIEKTSGAITPANDSVAFVVAHELAHLAEHHDLVLEIVSGEPKTASGTGDFTGQDVSPETRRKMEFRADRLGMLYLFLAGFSPDGALRFLHSYAQLADGTPVTNEYAARHPTFSERSVALRAYWNQEAAVAFAAYAAARQDLIDADHLADAGPASALPAERRVDLESMYRRALDRFAVFRGTFPDTKEAYNNVGFCHLKLALLHQPARRTEWWVDGDFDPAIVEWKPLTMGPSGQKEDHLRLARGSLRKIARARPRIRTRSPEPGDRALVERRSRPIRRSPRSRVHRS